MPNRILRDGILSSERVNELDEGAELFYRRLQSVVDDYGRYHANLTQLRSACYPLKVDKYKESAIAGYLNDCIKQGLIVVYEVCGKGFFLEIQGFKQQIRSNSKYPGRDSDTTCVADATQLIRRRIASAHLVGGVVEGGGGVVSVSGVEGGEGIVGARAPTPAVQVFEHWKITLKHPTAKLDDKRRDKINAALKLGYTVEQLQQAITGCSKTPHNMGQNERQQIYDGLELILRNADQIDRFMAAGRPKGYNAAVAVKKKYRCSHLAGTVGQCEYEGTEVLHKGGKPYCYNHDPDLLAASERNQGNQPNSLKSFQQREAK